MKNKRISIALIFNYSEGWIGGTYYILNLIAALTLLPDSKKPELIILSTEKDFNYLKEQTSYPFLTFDLLDDNPSNFILKFLNRLFLKLLKKKLFKRTFNHNIKSIFPYKPNNYLDNVSIDKRIYWIPDFQEKHFPEFYSKEHLDRELEVNTKIVFGSKKLLLSSQDAKHDLEQFYPNYRTTPYVVHFAVKFPDKSIINDVDLLSKYGITKPFYYAPNQFWKHKNQMLIIKAIEILKNQGIEAFVVFSGKEYDPRSPQYTDELKRYVNDFNLSENIKFLGFLERSDQLKLMEISRAVIQPSLFEGWSTVIEEGMALGKLIIASDLNVNKEQLLRNGIFFQRNNPQDLSEKLKQIDFLPFSIDYNYHLKQKKFAIDFLNCVNA